jgi:hypothetical protein
MIAHLLFGRRGGNFCQYKKKHPGSSVILFSESTITPLEESYQNRK